VSDPQPLILTLGLDPASQETLDALRRAHFPPERNHLAAHVTLFHHLPGEELAEVVEQVREVARRAPFEVRVEGVRSLGRGVAVRLASQELLELRADLARRFAGWLTPQDRQRFAPHVTVQNKVTPERARALLDSLTHELTAGAGTSRAPLPASVTATGLLVWRYLGGPWRPESALTFTHSGQDA
jgi:2'-5' RNA ligase